MLPIYPLIVLLSFPSHHNRRGIVGSDLGTERSRFLARDPMAGMDYLKKLPGLGVLVRASGTVAAPSLFVQPNCLREFPRRVQFHDL